MIPLPIGFRSRVESSVGIHQLCMGSQVWFENMPRFPTCPSLCSQTVPSRGTCISCLSSRDPGMHLRSKSDVHGDYSSFRSYCSGAVWPEVTQLFPRAQCNKVTNAMVHGHKGGSETTDSVHRALKPRRPGSQLRHVPESKQANLASTTIMPEQRELLTVTSSRPTCSQQQVARC